MNKLLLVLLLFAFLTTPLFAASPIIYYGTHSKDLTTAGLITQALQAGSTGQFNVSTVGLVSTTNGLHVGSSAQFQVDGSGNVVTTGSVSAGNLLSVDGNGHSFSFAGANLTSDYTVQVPATSGTVGQYMATDGSGNLNWRAPPTEKNYLAAGTNDNTGWTASGAGITCTTATTNLPDASVGTALAVTGQSGAAGTEYCFYNFDIDQADGSKVLKLVEDQLPVTAVASDFRLDVYSCTVAWSGTPATTCSGTATRLALSTDNSSGVTALPALTGTLTPPPTYSTPAYASAPHLQARIGLNGASTHQMNFAQVLTGPGTVVQSAVVGPTLAFASNPTVAGLGAGSGTVTATYSQVGSKMLLDFSFVKDGSAGTGTSDVTVALPSGFTIDTTALPNTSTNTVGVGNWRNTSSQFVPISIYTDGSFLYARVGGTANLRGQDLAATTGGFNFHVTLPIAQWAGQGTVNILNDSKVSPIRAGTIMPYAGSTAPAGWQLCDGSVLSQTTYPDLYTAIGSTWNTQTNPTTGSAYSAPSAGNFRVPDFRGVFLRAVGTASGQSAVTLGGYQADKTAPNGLTVTPSANQITNNTFTDPSLQNATKGGGAGWNLASGYSSTALNISGDAETRPRNVGVNYIIKLWNDRIDLAGFADVKPGVAPGLVPASGLPGSTSGSQSSPPSTAVGASDDGKIGQLVQNTWLNVNCATAAGLASQITLTAGDWDISAQGAMKATASSGLNAGANYEMCITTTSGSCTGSVIGVNYFTNVQSGSYINGTRFAAFIPRYPVSITSTTTYYVNADCNWSSNQPTVEGGVTARRVH